MYTKNHLKILSTTIANILQKSNTFTPNILNHKPPKEELQTSALNLNVELTVNVLND
jgi:hypothetical protein